jgi:hypothetical protein
MGPRYCSGHGFLPDSTIYKHTAFTQPSHHNFDAITIDARVLGTDESRRKQITFLFDLFSVLVCNSKPACVNGQGSTAGELLKTARVYCETLTGWAKDWPAADTVYANNVRMSVEKFEVRRHRSQFWIRGFDLLS